MSNLPGCPLGCRVNAVLCVPTRRELLHRTCDTFFLQPAGISVSPLRGWEDGDRRRAQSRGFFSELQSPAEETAARAGAAHLKRKRKEIAGQFSYGLKHGLAYINAWAGLQQTVQMPTRDHARSRVDKSSTAASQLHKHNTGVEAGAYPGWCNRTGIESPHACNRARLVTICSASTQAELKVQGAHALQSPTVGKCPPSLRHLAIKHGALLFNLTYNQQDCTNC